MTSSVLTSEVVKSVGREVEVSVIIPAYNEEAKIGETLMQVMSTLSATGKTFEVVVVDDGSRDGTCEKVKNLASECSSIRVIKNGINVGKGFAIKRASGQIIGKKVVLMDAGMEIDATQLRHYVDLLDRYDICISSKRHPQSVYDAPVMRKLLSVAFNKLVEVITGVRLTDTQTGLKAIRGDALKRIMNVVLVKRYAFDVEFLAIALLLKLKVVELPVRVKQGSTFSARAVMFMLVDLLGIAYRLRVIKWYQKSLEMKDPVYKALL